MRKFILLVIAVSVVNTANNGGLLNPFALNQAGKNQGFLFGLNPAGNTPGLLNLFNLPPIDNAQKEFNLNCFKEPFTVKERCQQQLNGVALTRLGTGLYSFQKDQKLTWFAARDWCKARGMELVTIDSAAEDQLISTYLFNYYVESGIAPGVNSFFWTGLNDLGKTSTFVWDANGLPLSGYTNWLPDQPDFPATEHCGEYWYIQDAATKPKWNNRNCTETPGPFICEVNSACRCYTFI